MPRLLSRRHGPALLALLSISLLGSYLIYTEYLMREIRKEAEIHTRMYAFVQEGLLSFEPEAELQALAELQTTVAELGVPIVALNADREPYAAVNLPFEADLADPADRERVLEYVAALDRQNTPIREPGVGTIHFGAPPIVGWLRWVPWLQVCGAVLLVSVALGLVRSHMRAERERTWAAMARELAHQMGTPLSSLAGWLEVLDLPGGEQEELASKDRIAREIGSDLERLERVSRRFELIGKMPALGPTRPEEVVGELEGYLRPRLPRLGASPDVRMRVRRGLPPVKANRVLVVWALENVVKNALDAVAGGSGRIRVAALSGERGMVRFAVSDSGPGIHPSVRERIFETGFSTKEGGWGVGLSLTRRIVEELHDGRVVCRPRRGGGTVFEIDLPAAAERSSLPRVEWRS